MNKSFVKNIIMYLILFTVVIILLFIFMNNLVNYYLSNRFPYLSDLLVYEDRLKEDDYNTIPLNKFHNSEFLIYGDNYEVLFSTNRNLANIITPEQLVFINDYYDESYYMVYEKKIDNEDLYQIIKGRANDDGFYEYLGYAILDKEYNILDGDLFLDKTKLTVKEFNLIQGIHSKEDRIEKISYETNDKKKRTLVFVSKNINSSDYQKTVNKANQIWFWVIPFFLIIIGIFTYLVVKNIKNSIDPLKEAVKEYEKTNKFVIDKENVPKEFQKLVDSFQELFKKMKREEEKKNKFYLERQQIFANLSHDIKIPLTVIEGYSKAFLDNIVPKNKEKEYMEAINNKCDNATKILDSLLEFTMYDSDNFKINLVLKDFCEFLREYLASKYHEIELAGFNMKIEIPEYPINFLIDEMLMKRCLANLISNSLKYNKKGTTIYIKLEEKDNKIYLRFADNGIGIAKSLQDNLFEPFVSGDKSRGNKSGSGLGLAIVNKIVNIHKGNIKLNSNPKKPFKTEFIMEFDKP